MPGPLGAGSFKILGMGDVLLRMQADGYLGRSGGKFGAFPLPAFQLADGVYGDITISGGGTVMTVTAIQNTSTFELETRTSDPASPDEGRMWLRTDL